MSYGVSWRELLFWCLDRFSFLWFRVMGSFRVFWFFVFKYEVKSFFYF